MAEDQVVGHENSTMIELFQCLPLIEHLTIWSETIWWFVPDLVPQEIDAEHYLFNDTDYDSDVYEEYHSNVWLEHLSNVWLEHLIKLKIRDFSNLEPELEFVKLILAKFPKLKKVSIKSVVKNDQESGMLKTLLRTPRVSAVEIDVV
ncbi:hypothetical protein Hanom_Chr08g00709981 [Helianthus anomalus]